MTQPTGSARLPQCVELASVFQDPLLEEPPAGNAPAAVRSRYAMLVAKAQHACASCPVIEDCLYTAVVRHDVAGYVGGTTPEERLRIRRALRISVQPEDLDTLAGVTGRQRQVDHDEVVRLRAAHPDESLETLARRLGCSLSTVKRHLRRERHTPSVRRAEPPKPSLSQVLAVAAEVTRRPQPDQQAA
jgi:Transcription factor WhiB